MNPSQLDPNDLFKHRDALRRMAYAIVGNDEHAEDLVQSTFVTALESPPPSLRSPRAWLRVVLLSRATDALRVGSRRRAAERALAREHAGRSDQVESCLDLAGEVVEAVRELKEPYRSAITLRYFEDLPPRAIALQVGRPLPTVKIQLARGLDMLRTRMSRSRDGSQRSLALALLPLTLHSAAAAPTIGLLMLKKLVLCATLLLALVGAWYSLRTPAPSRIASVAMGAEQTSSVTPPTLLGDSQHVPSVRTPVLDVAATSEAAATRRSGTLVIHALWADGSPATGLEIRVTSLLDPVVGRSTRAVVADASGVARVEGLCVGTALLESDRAPSGRNAGLRVKVSAGIASDVVFRQDPGVPVSGVVVDGLGQPVSGAKIWLANFHRDWRGGRVVAVSGATGQFELRDVGPTQSLGAIAAGFAPSELVRLELVSEAESPRRIRLELGDHGAALTGRVMGAASEPIPHARVAIGGSTQYRYKRADGSSIEEWSPRVAMTDSVGGFEFHGLDQGEQTLTVLAPGFAEWGSTVHLTLAAREPMAIHLQRGVRVRGVVHDKFGDAIEGAVVLALNAPFAHPDPTQGPFKTGGAFHWPAVHSDAQGFFELPPVPLGELHLHASKGARFGGDSPLRTWTVPQSFVGIVQETLKADSEGVLEWNPVLGNTLRIHGHVSYADGEPIVRAIVSAIDEETGKRFMDDSSGPDGSYSIPGLHAGTYTVMARSFDGAADSDPVVQRGVRPSDGPFELVASWSRTRVSLGGVEGSWLDSAQRLTSDSMPVFLLEDEGRTGWQHATIEDGRFQFTDVAAGRYRVRVLQADDPIQAWAWFDLAPGEELDLGALETEPGATLRVLIERDDTTRDAEFVLSVIAPDQYFPTNRTIPGDVSDVSLEGLAPGPVQVRFLGLGIADQSLDVELEAGAIVEVSKALEAGRTCSIKVSNPNGVDWNELKIELRKDGQLLDSVSILASETTLPHARTERLPMGKFEVVATTDTGHSARRAFGVSSLETTRIDIHLDLQRN